MLTTRTAILFHALKLQQCLLQHDRAILGNTYSLSLGSVRISAARLQCNAIPLQLGIALHRDSMLDMGVAGRWLGCPSLRYSCWQTGHMQQARAHLLMSSVSHCSAALVRGGFVET